MQHKINNKVVIKGALVQIGNKKIDYKNWDDDFINDNEFFCPDKEVVLDWENSILKARKNGSSLGAIIEIRCKGIPPGFTDSGINQ